MHAVARAHLQERGDDVGAGAVVAALHGRVLRVHEVAAREGALERERLGVGRRRTGGIDHLASGRRDRRVHVGHGAIGLEARLIGSRGLELRDGRPGVEALHRVGALDWTVTPSGATSHSPARPASETGALGRGTHRVRTLSSWMRVETSVRSTAAPSQAGGPISPSARGSPAATGCTVWPSNSSRCASVK